jgi:N-ethylmaleimide reductase
MNLFSAARLGAITIDNRVVLAPMTRLRADLDGVPTAPMVEYYAQRAGFGLIVTEGVYPSPEGQGYPKQPGIVTAAQLGGWRRVTDAVHEAGGRIMMQLMHAGHATHPEINGGRRVIAPSAIAIPGLARTRDGKVARIVAEAITEAEIPEVITRFAEAAMNAVEAGFDGVELHGANGYLLHQFHAANLNQRTDAYGGSPERRARFTIETVTAVANAIGAERTALRISPRHNFHGIDERDDADTHLTYQAVVDGIAPLGTAYLSYVPDVASPLAQDLRRRYGGPFLVNTGPSTITTRDHALTIMAEGYADAVVVGRAGLANPDLVRRWREDRELNEPRMHFFYSGSATGYTDYPPLAD